MNDWPTGIKIGPIGEWPGPLTPPGRREVSRFKTSGDGYRRVSTPWSSTLELLSRELREIGAKDHELLLAVPVEQFRLDGKPRSGAKAEHPGVILSFDMPKVGRMSYPCDNFTTWQDNVRAIALGLEALRKFARYKIGKHNQQYRSYLAIESTAMPSGFASVEDAWAFVRRVSGYDADETATPRLIRDAKRRTHPDVGGNASDFQRVTLAEQYLKQNGALR